MTDKPSGNSGTVNFTGLLSGAASGTPRAINSTITNYAVSPQLLNLGGSTYLVSVKPSTGPGSLFDGVLQGNISIVPEPASLAFLGLASASLLMNRRK